jgi:hypothetical protein
VLVTRIVRFFDASPRTNPKAATGRARDGEDTRVTYGVRASDTLVVNGRGIAFRDGGGTAKPVVAARDPISRRAAAMKQPWTERYLKRASGEEYMRVHTRDRSSRVKSRAIQSPRMNSAGFYDGGGRAALRNIRFFFFPRFPSPPGFFQARTERGVEGGEWRFVVTVVRVFPNERESSARV